MIGKNNLVSLFFEIALITLVILMPFFNGAAPFIFSNIFQIISLVLIFLFFLSKFVFNDKSIIYPQGIFFLLGFFFVMFFQILPLSENILNLLSSKTAYLYQKYNSSQLVNDSRTLSIYSYATKKEILKMLSFFSVFFITINVFKKRGQFERMVVVMIFLAVILAFYGIMKKFFISGREEDTVIFSIFKYRNHYANYIQMIAPLSMGYALYCKDKFKKVFFGFLTAIISASVFISLSRLGVISLVISFIFMGAIFFLSKGERMRKNSLIVIIVAIVVGLLFLSIGTKALVGRFSEAQMGVDSRVRIYKDSVRIVKDFPLWGVGLGNFRYIYTQYKSIYSVRFLNDVHSDYLQFLIEAGFIGLCLILSFFILLFKNILIGLSKRRDIFVKNIGIGGLCGLLGVIIHNLFDFGFHNLVVGFMFWLILGLVYKCTFTHFQE